MFIFFFGETLCVDVSSPGSVVNASLMKDEARPIGEEKDELMTIHK